MTPESRWHQWPDLSDVLSGIPWAIAGAVATRSYMPERATEDLDVVVLARDGARARELLRPAGFAYVGELSIGGSRWEAPDRTPVDVIEGGEPWWDEALRQASEHEHVVPLPYLVLMKLRASRTIDVGDVTRMLGYASDADLDAVRELFRAHAPDLSDDLESLIELGKLEWQADRDASPR